MADAPTKLGPHNWPYKIRLPGWGIPCGVLHIQTQQLTTVYKWDHPMLTLRERYMLQFINQITDEPMWTQKVFDEEIVGQWKEEACTKRWYEEWEDARGDEEQGEDFTEEMFTFCIQEVREKAVLYEKFSIVPVLDVASCVLKSDNAIPPNLKQELRSAVARLEDVPDRYKDWHPGSDGRTLDLVHPSLFPLIYGRSRILPNSTIDLENCLQSIGKGNTIPSPMDEDNDYFYDPFISRRFQWLPCNVSFPNGLAKIDSYINNLHPCDHQDLYHVIEKVIDKAVPFWNILCQSHYNGRITRDARICLSLGDFYSSPIDGGEPRQIPEAPGPGEFDQLMLKSEDVEDKFAFLGDGDKNLQVIVKLANILLTPDKPEYVFDDWHVEGHLNEHIVSTAIYYYDNENITDSRLEFSSNIHEDFSQPQGYRLETAGLRSMNEIFGFFKWGRCIQDIGSVLTREDRFIVFPNGFGRRGGTFKLADPTKPGHRKILALLLVAPEDPVISTANVPPQRMDWWRRELSIKETRLGALPVELLETVVEGVEEFPISMEEAKTIREELVGERTRMNAEADLCIARGLVTP